MKKVKLIISFSIILIIIIFTVVLFKVNNHFGKDKISLSNFSSDHCLTNYEINIKEEGVKIPNIQFDDSLLSFTKREKPILILRIKETYCSTCIENEINMINKMGNEIKDNLCILTSHSSKRNIKRMMMKYNIDIPYQEIPYNFLDQYYFEEFNAPYYFLLHKDMRISQIYLPEKALPKLTLDYFKNVKRLYCFIIAILLLYAW